MHAQPTIFADPYSLTLVREPISRLSHLIINHKVIWVLAKSIKIEQYFIESELYFEAAHDKISALERKLTR